MAKHAFSEYEVKRSDCLWFDPNDLVIITDKSNPFYDPRAELPLNEELVANILFQNQGVLEPVLITKDGDAPIVIAGRQRVKAARRANEILSEQGAPLLKVPCLNRKGNEAELYGIALSENEHRKGDSILDKAKKIQRYYNFGGTKKGAAEIFGVSITAISNWEKMLDLAAPIVKAIESGEISASAAAKLADLPRTEQIEKLKEITKTEKPTTKNVDKETKKSKPTKLKARSYDEIYDIYCDENLEIPEPAKIALRWVLKEIKEIPIEWQDPLSE